MEAVHITEFDFEDFIQKIIKNNIAVQIGERKIRSYHRNSWADVSPSGQIHKYYYINTNNLIGNVPSLQKKDM